MKTLLLILFIPFVSSPIRYRQLTWADFKGKPTNDHLASTCSGIVIEKDTAYAVFEPDKSWTRTSDIEILRHEQLHFKITEHWASVLASYEVERDLYIPAILDEWDKEEKRYDRETDHGKNLAAQKQWEERIKP